MLARRVSLVASAGAIALLVAGSPFSQGNVLADQFTQQIQSLSAQASALSHAIASLSTASSAALGNALASAQAIANTQAQLGQAQLELDQANKNLANTSAQLQIVHSQYTADQADLAQILKHVYELTDDGSVTAILVDSKSFIDAMDALTSADQVSTRVRQLVTQIQGKRDQLDRLQTQQQRDQQHANALVANLQTLAAQQTSEELTYRQQASSLKGKAATLLAELQGVRSKIVEVRREQEAAAAAAAAAAGAGAAHVLGNALRPFAFGPRLDDYPWGQCTWYVASLRNVYWSGNAWEWAYTARLAGRPEGRTPRVGSLVVFGPGNGYSQFGHVAYVVAVQGSSSFTVDEANMLGLGVVDQRHIGSLYDVEAFIY
ncbi:MAG: CHAP domain-containing protein [Candidatus Dormiibacterota bacterium]